MNALLPQILADVNTSADPIKAIYVPIGSDVSQIESLDGIPVRSHPSVQPDRYFLDKGIR